MSGNTQPDTRVRRSVQIPACDKHEGWHSVRVELDWTCPVCGGPRGDIFRTVSYDGSRRLGCDGWTNPCAHVDRYSAVRAEAKAARDA